MKIKRFHALKDGFTLVELMIVVAIIGLLVGVAFPNYVKSRTDAQRQVCKENLSQIETAKQLWGLEKSKSSGDTPTDADLIGTDLFIKIKPICPASGRYEYNAIGTPADCNIDGHDY